MTGRLAAAPFLLLLFPMAIFAPSPTPNLSALRGVLANAPDSSWVEAHPASDTLEGPFGATFYVTTEWSDQSTRDDIKNELLADAFLGGYGRTFDKVAAAEYITEDVKAFPDATHAMANYKWALNYFHDPNDVANNVSTPAIPNSFGGRYFSDPWHGIDIYFTKANYVFTVTVGAKSDYQNDLAVAQANAVYNFAPSRDVLHPSPAPGASASTQSTAAIVAGGAAFIVLVVVVAVVLLIVLTRRRRPAPAQQAMLSPDGQYWWDGTQWQPVSRR